MPHLVILIPILILYLHINVNQSRCSEPYRLFREFVTSPFMLQVPPISRFVIWWPWYCYLKMDHSVMFQNATDKACCCQPQVFRDNNTVWNGCGRRSIPYLFLSNIITRIAEIMKYFFFVLSHYVRCQFRFTNFPFLHKFGLLCTFLCSVCQIRILIVLWWLRNVSWRRIWTVQIVPFIVSPSTVALSRTGRTVRELLY